LIRRGVAAAALAAVASMVAPPSPASPSPAGAGSCTPGYSYAGYAGRDGVSGVAATISAPALPAVWSGHAAAWVGVGGSHEGLGNESEWLQAGIAAFPRAGLRLYVEEVSRGSARRFTDLGPALVGRRYRVRVVETGRDFWRAFVNGGPVGEPAFLPTVGGSWRPVATAESWAAGGSSCNRYAYRFDGISALQPDGWHRLGEAERLGTGVTRAGSGFSAFSNS
jgi:hypothetical protein